MGMWKDAPSTVTVAPAHDEWGTRDLLRQLDGEEQAFAEQFEDLISKYEHQFIAMVDGTVVDSDTDELALTERVLRDTFPRTALIKRVARQAGPPDVFHTPFEDPCQ